MEIYKYNQILTEEKIMLKNILVHISACAGAFISIRKIYRV